MFITYLGFHGGSDDKESACNVRDLGSIPGLGRFPWRREQLPTPVFWPGESDGQRSLASYSPWGRQESDTNEGLTVSVYIHISPYVHTLFICHLGIVFHLPIILWYICIFLFGRTMLLTITMKTIKPLVIKVAAIFNFYEEKNYKKGNKMACNISV